MRRRWLLVVAAALALAACDDERRAVSRDDLPDVGTEPDVVVEMDDDGFDPSEIAVRTDDLVEFVNVGDGEHGVRTEDSSIDTGRILPGESTYVMFDEEARYQLLDVADDTHTASVVATAPPPPG